MKKIKVLILTGNLLPMHDYRRVNDILRITLEASGHFEVRISEEAHGVTAETLEPYDLVLMNYDGLEEGVARGGHGRPAGGFDEPFCPLGETTEQALATFVSTGHGILFFHTAVCGEPERWSKAYNEMLGSVYGKKALMPYRASGYTVRTHLETGHPVTQGVSSSWKIADDDFLNNVTLCDGTTCIASIHDPVNDIDAPVMWCKSYGQGRSFACALGHQEDTIRRLDFCRLLIHACDWCATGTTDIPLPDRDSGNNWMRSWPWYYCPVCGLYEHPLQPIGY